MCGRFTLTEDFNLLGERFAFRMPDIDWHPRYNLAPAQEALTVVATPERREARLMLWGMIPHWSKDRKIGYRMINARAETLAEKPSFRMPLKKQRCLVLADGFYEWREEKGKKIPFRIVRRDGKPFAFAGLWDRWNEIQSFTIVTTNSNKLLSEIHDRMPVMLLEESEEKWLDPGCSDPDELEPLLKSYPSDLVRYYPVSSIVNSWKNDTPECILEAQD